MPGMGVQNNVSADPAGEGAGAGADVGIVCRVVVVEGAYEETMLG